MTCKHDYAITLDITEVPVEYWEDIDAEMHKLLDPVKDMFPGVRVHTDQYGIASCDKDHAAILGDRVLSSVR